MLSQKDFKAPNGMYRVIGVDTFDDDDWIEGDFSTSKEAIDRANEKGGEMLKCHVYDDTGKHIAEAGTY